MHPAKTIPVQPAHVKAPLVNSKTTSGTPQQEQLIVWLKSVKFKRCLWGGVSEKDVWEKIQELHTLYTNALNAEKIRYAALLQSSLSLEETISPNTKKENPHESR